MRVSAVRFAGGIDLLKEASERRGQPGSASGDIGFNRGILLLQSKEFVDQVESGYNGRL